MGKSSFALFGTVVNQDPGEEVIRVGGTAAVVSPDDSVLLYRDGRWLTIDASVLVPEEDYVHNTGGGGRPAQLVSAPNGVTTINLATADRIIVSAPAADWSPNFVGFNAGEMAEAMLYIVPDTDGRAMTTGWARGAFVHDLADCPWRADELVIVRCRYQPFATTLDGLTAGWYYEWVNPPGPTQTIHIEARGTQDSTGVLPIAPLKNASSKHRRITAVRLLAVTGPSGGAHTADVLIDDVLSLWEATEANRPSLADSETEATAGALDNPIWAPGEYLHPYWDVVNSAADVRLEVDFEELPVAPVAAASGSGSGGGASYETLAPVIFADTSYGNPTAFAGTPELSGDVVLGLSNTGIDISRVRMAVVPGDVSASPPTWPDVEDEEAWVHFVRGDGTPHYTLAPSPVVGAANVWRTDPDDVATGKDLPADPTGNNRTEFESDGTFTWGIECTRTDGYVEELWLPFTTANTPAGGTAPDTPTGLEATPSANAFLIEWDANDEVDLAGYEVRLDAVNDPPETVPIGVADAEAVSLIVSNLEEDTTYNIDIRAYDTDGDRSGWSATIQATTPAGDPPDPEPGRLTGVVGGVVGRTTTFGPPIDYSGLAIPKSMLNANIDRKKPEAAYNQVYNTLVNAVDVYSASHLVHPDWDLGLMAVFTLGLAFMPGTAKPPYNNVTSALELAKTARGERDYVYQDVCDAINQASADALGGITNWDEHVIIRIAHECNIPAFPHYYGTDETLVGNNTLLNSGDQLLIDIATDEEAQGKGGDRALLWKAAYRRAALILRDGCPGVAFTLNLAHPGADFTNSNDGLSRDWVPHAYPGNDVVDDIGMDAYCRSDGRSLVSMGERFDELETLIAEKGRPCSFPEFGVVRHNDDNDPAQVASTDSVAASWVAYVKSRMDTLPVTYATFWGSQKNDQGDGAGYRYRPTPTDDPQTWQALKDAGYEDSWQG